ncbi:MAG: SHOCT domain-containing protein [Thermodesulfobacteriota bacterium]
MTFKNQNEMGLFKGIFTASVILLLHVVLLAVIGSIIILFKGMYQYLPWIMGGLGILITATVWILYQRMKKNSADIKEVLSMPQFQNREVEVKFLGGMASFKIAPETNQQTLIEHHALNKSSTPMIENGINKKEQKIFRLKELFKKENLMDKEEFEKAKQDILQG